MNIHETTQWQTAFGILCAHPDRNGDRDGVYPTFCRVPVQSRTTPHAHYEPEIFYIIQGQGLMSLNGEDRLVQTGELIRIPPFTPHFLTNIGESELQFLSVYSEDFDVAKLPTRAVLTVAPPTPNGPLHLGHISGPYLASDIQARYLKLRSVPVHRHGGTDDHQNYVTEKARALGENADEFRGRMRTRIHKGLENLDIAFDEWIEPAKDLRYQEQTQEFARRAIRHDIIQKVERPLPYCETCQHPLVDALISGDCPACEQSSRGGCESCGIVVPPWELVHPRCAHCDRQAQMRTQTVFVFPLGAQLPSIRADLQRLNLPPRLREMVERFANNPQLEVLVASPNTAGIPLEGTDLSLHVWFEMAAHYQQFAHLRANSSAEWIHSFGFDNSFYYLLFIPALLRAMSSDARLPDAVLTNEFLTLDGAKFSTSRGHAIWADEFQGPTEALRLYLCLQRPERQMKDFVLKDFEIFSQSLQTQISALQNQARRLKNAPHQGAPSPSAIIDANRLTRDLEATLSPRGFSPRRAARRVLDQIDQALHAANEGADERLHLHALAMVLAPFMPKTSESLFDLLDEAHRHWINDWGMLK